MKVLDVSPFQDGLRRNIMMLDRLGNEMESIQKSVEGLVAMEDALKGEGGNAIRAFYADCHLPFLQFFMLFQGHFTTVLKQMVAALDTLEPDPSGYIQEHFLESDIEQGLRHIAQLTESLTDETNSIMNQVSDIVFIPRLDDSEVQYGVRNATIKRDDTVTQLHEFDANQTTALRPIAQDLLTMETWISDIESMFREGLTDVHFESIQWAALSSKNTLQTDLAQYTGAMTGLPVMMGLNGQPITMLGALLAGENPLKFSYGFVDGPNLLYELGILTFSGMATYGRPIATVNGELTSNEEQVKGFITEGEELSPDEVAQLINYLKNTDFDDPNRKNGIQMLPAYDEEITFEGMRKVLGGNGPGTPDGLAPYTMGAFNFFTEDIGTMLGADATANERLAAAAFTFIKPAKLYDTAHDAWKIGEKAKDAGKGTGKGKHLDDIPRIKEVEVNFKRNDKHDSEEFARQLKDQEKGMNELTVDEYLKNRDRYIAEGRAIEGNAAQKMARQEALKDKISELRKQGLSRADATKQASEWLETKAALHNPDQIAGGRADIIGSLGDKRVNSSIGSQWKYRIDVVDEQIRGITKNMSPEQLKNTYINVKLTQ